MPRRAISGLVAVLAISVLSVSDLRAQEPLTLAVVLDRMRAYLTDYATRLPATLASEHYVQRAYSGVTVTQVTLDSDFGIVQVPGLRQWLGFRDVLKTNGKPVPDHERRLDDLFLHQPTDVLVQARRITEESARHNIGSVIRTINNPALALELLDGRNAHRMRFEKSGEDTRGNVRAWVIRFNETWRPTLVSSKDGMDAPSKGRAWIDPATGTLLRAETSVQAGALVSCTIDLTFEPDPRLGFWVPARMNETYDGPRAGRVASGTATYTNYRQFAVDTNETLTP